MGYVPEKCHEKIHQMNFKDSWERISYSIPRLPLGDGKSTRIFRTSSKNGGKLIWEPRNVWHFQLENETIETIPEWLDVCMRYLWD